MPSGPFDVIALVASAGGHAAVTAVLRGLPPNFRTPIVVVQHLAPESTSTVELYGRQLPFAVEWARADAVLLPGTVLVCPPRSFLELHPDGTCVLSPCDRGAIDKPIDRFLDSIASSFGPRAIGVVLTGMGSDGALGAHRLRSAGGRMLVQSEVTSVSPEMPRAAIQSGAADLVAPLADLGQVIGEIVAGAPHPQPRSELDAIVATFGDEGEIAALARATNWTETPLGPVREWSPVLRSTLRLAMSYPTPFSVLWGPRLVHFYNDAGSSTHGEDHPRSFGKPVAEGSPEKRDTFEALWRRALAGETMHHAARLVPLLHDGKPLDAWFDFVHVPLRDTDGSIGGVATISEDRTFEVVASRRLQTLHALTRRESASHRREVLVQALEVLGTAPDVSFAVAYSVTHPQEGIHLVATAGVDEGGSLAPWTRGEQYGGWPLKEVIRSRTSLCVDDVATRFPDASAGRSEPAPERAVLEPLLDKANNRVAGVLVLGVEPRLPLDAPYREFLRLAAEIIAVQLAEAQAVELEREQRERLAELDRTKTEFFANVSHEFRTPLTLLLAPLEELLRRREELPPALAQDVDVAATNSRRLLRLVNNLLDFSQIDTRRRQATFAPTDLGALTLDITSAFRSAIEAAGIDFQVRCEPNLKPVWIDRAMWETIVSNLVANALKFTFEGEIAVELRGLALHAELVVRDTGIGIPEHELPNLFKRFHRVRGARARTVEGAGIGLSLVEDQVKRMGGRLRVRSVEGRGTAFTLWMPYKTARLTADAPASPPVASSGKLAEELAKDATRWLRGASVPPGDVQEDLVGVPVRAPAAACGRIIVVDDNADLRAYLERLLRPRWEVELTPDGESALNAATRRRPDLFLADVMMPGLDGFQFIERVREHPGLKHTPVVLLTARAGETAAIEGLRAGAADYIAKPFSPRELVARLEAVVERARVETALRESEAKYRALVEN